MLKLNDFLKHRRYLQEQRVNLLYPNEVYLASENNVNKADLHRFRFIYNLHKKLSGRMLDIGCNDGYFMRKFPWKFSQYLGVDIYHILQYTRGKFWLKRKYYTKNRQIRYVQGYFEDLAPKLGKFDFVFAGEIIEHVQDPDQFLRSLKSTLNPGGVWCLSTPDSIGGDLPEHNRQFNKSSLSALLTKYFHNFKIYQLKSPGDSWPFLIASGKLKST